MSEQLALNSLQVFMPKTKVASIFNAEFDRLNPATANRLKEIKGVEAHKEEYTKLNNSRVKVSNDAVAYVTIALNNALSEVLTSSASVSVKASVKQLVVKNMSGSSESPNVLLQLSNTYRTGVLADSSDESKEVNFKSTYEKMLVDTGVKVGSTHNYVNAVVGEVVRYFAGQFNIVASSLSKTKITLVLARLVFSLTFMSRPEYVSTLNATTERYTAKVVELNSEKKKTVSADRVAFNELKKKQNAIKSAEKKLARRKNDISKATAEIKTLEATPFKELSALESQAKVLQDRLTAEALAKKQEKAKLAEEKKAEVVPVVAPVVVEVPVEVKKVKKSKKAN
jgi:hypothetical protein